jgi:hypothetical protein
MKYGLLILPVLSLYSCAKTSFSFYHFSKTATTTTTITPSTRLCCASIRKKEDANQTMLLATKGAPISNAIDSFITTTATTIPTSSSTSSSWKSKDGTSSSKREQKRLARLQRTKRVDRETVELWQQQVQEYTHRLLHDSYLHHPVRASTILASAEYPQGVVGTTASSSSASSSASTVLHQTLMPGNHKHLGGAYDPTDGSIYGVPAHAQSILCLHPVVDNNSNVVVNYSMTTIPLPKSIAKIPFKWLRGIFAHGYLWAIPAWAPAVLCVDIDAYRGRRPSSSSEGSIVQLIPLPSNHPSDLTWQWHGAGMNHEKTAIYCIPSNAHAVLKVDLMTKSTSLISIDVPPHHHHQKPKYPNFDISQCNKWYGGIVGADNAVYGIPYRSCAVLRIDCNTNTASLVGRDYGSSYFNWHGGIQVNGCIYAHPSHATTVLVINTNHRRHNKTTLLVTDENSDNNNIDDDDGYCYEIPITRCSNDTNSLPTTTTTSTATTYQWLGGTVGADGNIYCPPCDTADILKICTTTQSCQTFGHTTLNDHDNHKNKWQGGVYSARDECIYMIPASGRYVLRIATSMQYSNNNNNNNKDNPYQLLGPLPSHRDKWQGGYVGLDGCLYFVPECGYRVLKIIPPQYPPVVDINHQLPIDDVTLELL